MKELTVATNAMQVVDGKVTSLELVKEINMFRADIEGKSAIQHKTLLDVIRNEFEEEIAEQEILPSTYKDSNNKEQPMFELTIAQAKQVLVRESKFVRKGVIKRLDELEAKHASQIELSEDEMIVKSMAILTLRIEQQKKQLEDKEKSITHGYGGHLGRHRKRADEQKEMLEVKRDKDINPAIKDMKVKLNETKEYATILTVEKITGGQYNWRELKRYCNDVEIDIKDVPDDRWGTVKSYPSNAWYDVYGIVLADIL